MRYVMAVVAVLLAGCSSRIHTVRGPDGNAWTAINCSRRNQTNCFKRAGQLCPSGYDVAPESGIAGNMLIRCRHEAAQQSAQMPPRAHQLGHPGACGIRTESTATLSRTPGSAMRQAVHPSTRESPTRAARVYAEASSAVASPPPLRRKRPSDQTANDAHGYTSEMRNPIASGLAHLHHRMSVGRSQRARQSERVKAIDGSRNAAAPRWHARWRGYPIQWRGSASSINS